MKRSYGNKDLFLASVIVILVFLTSFSTLSSNSLEIHDKKTTSNFGSRSFLNTVSSLSGEGNLENTTDINILGQQFPGPGGRLGDYIWTGDINDDGLEDLCVASSNAPGQVDVGNKNVGYIYIWYGNGTMPVSTFDLDQEDPDMIIKGGHEYSFLPGSMDIAYLNDDPYIDIILGVPEHPSCGRIFVLWGDQDGWPSIINLPDPGRLSPNGDPYGFDRGEDIFILAGHLAPVPWPEANYLTGTDMDAVDADNDGNCDLVFSSPGWNHVVILWGDGSKYYFGNEMTIVQDEYPSSRFGEQLEIGDIDNDGWPDLVVSSPYITEDGSSRYESGAVFVYYNMSTMRGSQNIDSLNAYPIIYGSGSYDRCGFGLKLIDIDHDDNYDIIFGSPDADGPADTRSGAGAIYIIKGGDISKFPQKLYTDSGSDRILHGEKGKNGDIPGDRLGSKYDLGDIDGDGEYELVVGLSGRYREGTPMGCVIGYETEDSIASSIKNVDFKGLNKKFIFWGSDIMDQAGYTVSISDITNDGVDDLITGMTGSDGPGNSRKNIGEVFIHPGSNIAIGDIVFKGDAYQDGLILPNMDGLDITVPIVSTGDISSIESISILLDPEDLAINILYQEDQITMVDPFDIFHLDGRSTFLSVNGNTGRLNLRLNISWDVVKEEPWDLSITVKDVINVTRSYNGILKFIDKLILDDESEVLINGKKVKSLNDWIDSNDMITIRSLSLRYKDTDMIVDGSDRITLDLYSNDQLIGSYIYDGPSTSINITVNGSGQRSFRLVPSITPNEGGISSIPDPPSINGESVLDLRVDGDDPLPPDNISFISEKGSPTSYDNDNEWKVNWDGDPTGESLDPDGSGIKYFKMSIDGENTGPVRERGGLMSTYYNGYDFDIPMIHRVDTNIDNTINDWGFFGPDDRKIISDDFSVRWYGWFKPTESRYHTFSIQGEGDASLIIDGATMIDWSNIEVSRQTSEIFMNEGEYHEIMVLYSNSDIQSAISLWFQSDEGSIVPVPSRYLHYPANTTTIDITSTEDFDMDVFSVDWVGRVSSPASLQGIVDVVPPLIDVSGVESWYYETEPNFLLIITDPASGNRSGSGIDLSTFEFRYKNRDLDEFTEWIKPDPNIDIIENGTEGPVMVSLEYNYYFEPNWKGSIQWKISDKVGNERLSPTMDIGIDRKAPTFVLREPSLEIVHKEGENDITILMSDIGGSGIDGSTLEWRSGHNDDLGTWKSLISNGSGQQIEVELKADLIPGKNNIQFRVHDQVGNQGISDIFVITAEEVEINLPPVVIIDSPVNGSLIYIGSSVILNANASYDDGKGEFVHLRFTWVSNIEGYLGSGPKLDEVRFYSEGEHRIRVYVDDGTPGHNVSADVYIEVREKTGTDDDSDDDDSASSPEGTNYFQLLLIFLLILAIIIVLIMLLIRRSRSVDEEEVKLDLIERTEDDYDYEQRIIDEEKELGIYVDEGDLYSDLAEAEGSELYNDEY